MLTRERLQAPWRALAFREKALDSTLSASIVGHASVSLLANEFDVQSVLHRQVRLELVNQICVIHEVINDCKILRFIKGLLRKCKYTHKKAKKKKKKKSNKEAEILSAVHISPYAATF